MRSASADLTGAVSLTTSAVLPPRAHRLGADGQSHGIHRTRTHRTGPSAHHGPDAGHLPMPNSIGFLHIHRRNYWHAVMQRIRRLAVQFGTTYPRGRWPSKQTLIPLARNNRARPALLLFISSGDSERGYEYDARSPAGSSAPEMCSTH